MTDLSKLRAKLGALRAKTTANGCTEAEAMAAAEKAASLMEEHGISEADLDRGAFEEIAVELGARRSPLDAVWKTVAKFADCYGYLLRDGGRWRYVYFGREADVLIAEYVHEVVRRAAGTAVTRFKTSPAYQSRRKPKTRAQALKAFLEGFSISIQAKLIAGLWKRKGGEAGGARDLVADQQATLKAELERRGITFDNLPAVASASGKFRDSVRASGFGAAQKIAIEAGVSGPGPSPVGRLLS
ncbi:hypothetical protein C3941_09295 [Kaistia algarum]|uniref:DUF7168 domain-containing protein n=1 Tax=Kaistia algarum TaxID=2083279 RepID=UPI000CE839CE|nr:DUF2786 domain-containing protein [Kaistia algarum]MCX5512254.1 DUF2786 domain-containing protein [Kaistia algarum]PPE80345.1 hypothetical protein C3941_09295 [Kaistia algarum]